MVRTFLDRATPHAPEPLAMFVEEADHLGQDAGELPGIDLAATMPHAQRLRTHTKQARDMSDRGRQVRMLAGGLCLVEHPQCALAHLGRVLLVHRGPSLLQEQNEPRADSTLLPSTASLQPSNPIATMTSVSGKMCEARTLLPTRGPCVSLVEILCHPSRAGSVQLISPATGKRTIMGQRSVCPSIMKAGQEDFVVDNPVVEFSYEELRELEARDASAFELVSEAN